MKQSRISKCSFSIILILSLFFITGCGKEEPVVEEPIPLDYEHITWQMDKVSSTTGRHLDDNTFYVEHTNEDGSVIYYPLGEPTAEGDNYYYLSNTEDIPTLFLGQGDRLVYHSYTSLLRNIFFSRVQDLGYTIGIYDISKMENGRCFLGTGAEHVLSVCTDAKFLEEQEAEDILIAEMGRTLPAGYTLGTEPVEATKTVIYDKGTNILSYYDGLELTTTRDLSEYNTAGFNPDAPDLTQIRYKEVVADEVKQGILYGLQQDESYHIEFYSGTYYDTSNMTANIHIFTPVEYYHTNVYKLRQGTLFEIDFPEQMLNGIYTVNTILTNGAPNMFRLVRETDYSIHDTFNDYTFPEGLAGVYSEVENYNLMVPEETLVDETASLDLSRIVHPWYLFYSSEVNTMTWLYQKDIIQYGNLMNSHKELISQIDAPFVTIRANSQEDNLIMNLFYKELPEGKEFPPIEGVTQYIYTNADIVFCKGKSIIFQPKEGLTGLMVFNAEFHSKVTPAMTPDQESSIPVITGPLTEEEINQEETIPDGTEGVNVE